MKFKQTLWSLCGIAMLMALTTNLHAQVTIGSKEKPASGALLQLKSLDGITDGATNASKGIGLPRVLLYGVNSLDGIVPDDVNRPDNIAHIGLLVYNTSNCLSTFDNDIGLRVWDGKEWRPLVTPPKGYDESLLGSVVGKSGTIIKREYLVVLENG